MVGGSECLKKPGSTSSTAFERVVSPTKILIIITTLIIFWKSQWKFISNKITHWIN